MALADTIWSLYTTAFNIVLFGWPFILIVCGFIMKWRWKNWPVEAVIIEKRGSNLIKTNDRAGKYKDPYTDLVGYRLQKANDTIPVINFDWVLHNVHQSTNLMEKFIHLIRGNIGTVFLFRYGSKQYKPIKIIENENSEMEYKEIKDSSGKPIFVSVYQQFDPRDKLGALDFEVVDWDNMNFMVQEQRASMERRKKKGDWIKQIAVPLAMAAMTLVLCIIMIKYGFDYALAMKGASPGNPSTTPTIPILGNLPS